MTAPFVSLLHLCPVQFNHCLKDIAKSVTGVVALHNDQLQNRGVCVRACVHACMHVWVGVASVASVMYYEVCSSSHVLVLDGTQEACFLSRIPLQPFIEAESSFTRALTEYIKSQHLQSLGKIIGPSNLAVEGGGGGGVKDPLDLNSSAGVLAQGIPPSDYRRQCQELKRLQCM